MATNFTFGSHRDRLGVESGQRQSGWSLHAPGETVTNGGRLPLRSKSWKSTGRETIGKSMKSCGRDLHRSFYDTHVSYDDLVWEKR